MADLTPRESACLGFIVMYTEMFGRAPSYADIARHFHMNSKTGAEKLVTKLRRMGLIDRGGKRIKGSREGGLRVVIPYQDQSFHQAQAQQ